MECVVKNGGVEQLQQFVNTLSQNSFQFIRTLGPGDNLDNISDVGMYQIAWGNYAPQNAPTRNNWEDAILFVYKTSNSIVQKVYNGEDGVNGSTECFRVFRPGETNKSWQQVMTQQM